MKARWIILSAAVVVCVAAWSAVAVAYFFFDPGVAVWAALVTIAAISLEALFWVAAGALGWSFLSGRRATLERLRQRLFGGKSGA